MPGDKARPVLRTLCVESKALVIFTEFGEGREPSELAAILDGLTSDASERGKVLERAVEMMMGRKYPVEAVSSLVAAIHPSAEAATPPERPLLATRRLRRTPRTRSGSPRAPAGGSQRSEGAPFFGKATRNLKVEKIVGSPESPLRVLIADDDRRDRLLYRIGLADSGYRVVEASNGQDAWKEIRSGQVDAVILDIKMPGYHGLEILSRMSDSGLFLPVVVCTAYDRYIDEFLISTYPLLRYLVKPVASEDILAALDELIREARA